MVQTKEQTPLHLPVLLTEINALLVQSDAKTIFDGTVGLGGHAKEILKTNKNLELYIACDADQQHLNISQEKLFDLSDNLNSKVPLIVVSGTCMNVGKTSVACEIISHANKNGFRIAGTKLAGVACLRDSEKMKDYGAFDAVSFLDAGMTSTIGQNDRSLKVTKGALNFLAEKIQIL